jgi:hypothetical protein
VLVSSRLAKDDNSEPIYHVVVRLAVGVCGTFVRGLGVIVPREGRELSILIPESITRRSVYPPEGAMTRELLFLLRLNFGIFDYFRKKVK